MPSPAAQFLNTFASAAHGTRPQHTVAGYTLGQTIGYGSTSIIRKAHSASGSVAAAKVISLSSSSHTSTLKHHLREASTWSLLSHEHILPLFAFHHTHSHIYFFTLFCPAGSLLDVLKSLGSPALLQDDAGMIFRQVVRGLRYLHEEAMFVHRDIKLENVLIDEMGVCRIADFGMAVRISDPDSHAPSEDEDEDDLARLTTPRYHRNSTSTHSLLSLQHHNHHNHFQPGSLPYAAPELLVPPPIELHPYHPTALPRPRPSQDIWALGVLLYALLAGSLPFFDTFEPRLQLKILNGSYTPPHDIGLGAERILRGCLDKSVHSRWTIAMVDEVAWGVGWGREGDGAGAGEIDEEDQVQDSSPRGRQTQINSAAFVHRDHHIALIPSPKKRRARSKSLGAPPSRSLSPASLSPSPSYRFPPSPSSRTPSISPSRSPMSPLSLPLASPIEIEVVSSPKSLTSSDFGEVDAVPERGRKMRAHTLPLVPDNDNAPRPLCRWQHQEEGELDLLS